MGPIGWPELIIILVIILVIFGPKRLPEVGRSLGKGLREFKKSSSDIKEQLTEEKKAPPTIDKTVSKDADSSGAPEDSDKTPS